MDRVSDKWRLVIGAIVLVILVAIITSAIAYNFSQAKLCAENGMVMVQHFPHGDYGCAVITPFEELR